MIWKDPNAAVGYLGDASVDTSYCVRRNAPKSYYQGLLRPIM